MRVFKTKWFTRFARREKISDASLNKAIERAEKGLVDADLGGNVVKQRIAREGGGRSGGYRTLVAFKSQKRAVFIYGFAKNELDNIDDNELRTLKEIAAGWLKATDKELKRSLDDGLLQEVKYAKKN
ncbi:MAG: type II toxin-antitoxin system RelE/ParE family toxin [Parachlamydia sp.]|nr:type II toxin-antitoxin system RelE/ParE family toxin [Parachlamydia sp.]